ncbi:MAG: hypothetical protein DMG05_24030 [Acidobacteria bacterium]|nr:MAG: hypothetical protein DMG05_24030 [Acidobacteriota bacterium]
MSAKQITCIIIAMLAAILANAESKIDPDVLKSYAGTYKGKNVEGAEVEFRFLFKDGELFGHYVKEKPWKLIPINQSTFYPEWASDKVTITFDLENGKVISATLKDDDESSAHRGTIILKKVLKE